MSTPTTDASYDELKRATRCMLADAQRDTKKNGLRIDALARAAKERQT
ncbi:MAG: hypothetical protein ACHQ9S_27085 [Candidatus Binatia bacterium]